MRAYLELLERVISKGRQRRDRTGVGTISLFGERLQVDLADGFPLLTTKQVWFRGVAEELLWMLSGSTSVLPLQAKGVHIWDNWAGEDGELGPVYGKQWRDFGGVDQIKAVIMGLQQDPFGRRHIVSAWNPVELPQMALPPCPVLFQFYVETSGRISCHLYQRSADIFLGVPFDLAGYALLTSMIAHCLGRLPGTLTISFGDLHLYLNHQVQAGTQLSRKPVKLPRLGLNELQKDLLALSWEDLLLEGYEHQGAIPAPIAV